MPGRAVARSGAAAADRHDGLLAGALTPKMAGTSIGRLPIEAILCSRFSFWSGGAAAGR
jgi:hypothetical protein